MSLLGGIQRGARQNEQDFQVRNFLKVMKESIDSCAEQTLTNTDTMKYIIYDNII